MTSHTTRQNVSRLDVISTGARRRWTVEEKLRIVAESASLPRNVSATARRHGISPGQLFAWRKLSEQGLLAAVETVPGFVPALVAARPLASATSSTVAVGRMQVVLAERGLHVIVGPDVDAGALRRIIDALERP